MRHFKITSIELSPGGPGPDRVWRINYTAYVKKKWVAKQLWQVARTEQQARSLAISRWQSNPE